jgi:antitoxin VapB
MALNLKDDALHAAVRDLARRRGLTLTAAVSQAVQEALERERQAEAHRVVPFPLDERLLVIARRCAQRPDLDVRSAEAICGFDEDGLPT